MLAFSPRASWCVLLFSFSCLVLQYSSIWYVHSWLCYSNVYSFTVTLFLCCFCTCGRCPSLWCFKSTPRAMLQCVNLPWSFAFHENHRKNPWSFEVSWPDRGSDAFATGLGGSGTSWLGYERKKLLQKQLLGAPEKKERKTWSLEIGTVTV